MNYISVGFGLAMIAIFSSCGGDSSADQLCRKRLNTEKVIGECKAALKNYCDSSELDILSACDQGPLTKECLNNAGKVKNTCDQSYNLIASCSFGAEKSLLKPEIAVPMCVEDVKKSCPENYGKIGNCLEGDKKFCTTFFLGKLPKSCSQTLDDLLVSFKPGGGVRDSCEKAAKNNRLIAGKSAAKCIAALEGICKSREDLKNLEECSQGTNFCKNLFQSDMTANCKKEAKAYIVGF